MTHLGIVSARFQSVEMYEQAAVEYQLRSKCEFYA